jgi:hypothetical protein
MRLMLQITVPSSLWFVRPLPDLPSPAEQRPLHGTATDPANSASCSSFTVTVEGDTTPPQVTCPADITVDTTSCINGGEVDYVASASDSCLDTFECNPPAGSAFPVGTTTATCTATDLSGNSATCSFDVNVNCLDLICRTAGFWGTHAGTECPKKQPNCWQPRTSHRR